MTAIKKGKESMTTIQVTRAVAAQLQSLGRWGDTYSTIIERLLDRGNPGKKGAPDEKRVHESTGSSDNKKG